MTVGDEFAHEMLSHAGQMFPVALRMTRNHADAEDLLQETYLRAWRGRSTFQAGTNLRAWLFRIMTNTWINRYNKAKSRPEELGLDVDAQGTVGAAAAPTADSAEDVAMARLGDPDIADALSRLPDEQRLPVLLADSAGFKYREVAQILDLKLGTVMSRLHRGRRRLKDELHALAVRRVRDAPMPDGLMDRVHRSLERADDGDTTGS
jgi:RNA polymerase sigma-70 factor (ECF subfamily)